MQLFMVFFFHVIYIAYEPHPPLKELTKPILSKLQHRRMSSNICVVPCVQPVINLPGSIGCVASLFGS